MQIILFSSGKPDGRTPAASLSHATYQPQRTALPPRTPAFRERPHTHPPSKPFFRHRTSPSTAATRPAAPGTSGEGGAGFLPSFPGVASGCPGFEPGDPSPAAAVRLARGTPSSAPGVSPQPCRCRFPVRILRRDARRHKVRRNRYEKHPGNRPYRFFGFDCGSKVRIFHFFSLYWRCNI